MNILLIAAREINPLIGGIERVSYSLTEKWLQRGCEVSWLAIQKSRWDSQNNEEITKQYFLPNSQCILSNDNVSFVLDLVKKNKVDVVINQATIRDDVVQLCAKIKELSSIRLISVIHFAPGTEYDIARHNLFLQRDKITAQSLLRAVIECVYFLFINSRKIKQKEKEILARICQTSDRVIVLSEGFIPGFKKIYNSDKYQSISNPITETKQSLPAKKKQVLYVARIEYGMKRFDRMLDIWTKVGVSFPDWELIVVGDGDYLPHFRKLAEERHLGKISFVGFRPPEAYYETASILCLTSTTEGFGMILVEAMQYGCVPVAYNSYAALADIVEDGVNGYAVTAFNKKEYVTKLSQLMRDNDMRRKMAEAALLVPPKFDAHIIAQKWVNLFESLS